MTRNGKIARLPAAIREELNQRLLEGEPGQHLVLWLNGLPRVQALLKDKFQGIPIPEANHSHWKNGGFPAWEAGEKMADTVNSIARSKNPELTLPPALRTNPVKVNSSEFK
jgi:hypothetical protein